MRLLLAALTLPVAVATVIGLVLLWPAGGSGIAPAAGLATTSSEDAVVVDVVAVDCGQEAPCQRTRIRLDSGPDAGRELTLPDAASTLSSPMVAVGDAIVVSRTTLPEDFGETVAIADDLPGSVPGGSGDLYAFADYQRRTPMWVLAGLFVAIVIGIGRRPGAGALAGLAVTWALLLGFVIPAILEGSNPVVVALVGTSAMLFVVLYLAHGVNVRTTTALLGTVASLALTGVLAAAFVGASRITGLSSEEGVYLQVLGQPVELQGLLLGSIIIGALGALNDVTVTQAAATWELRAAKPQAGFRDVYTAGMRIGRDHIASTVDTLVLAYAGASLPLLILFTLGSQGWGGVMTSEIVAIEVIRTLVGSIGLAASVPITTALAAAVVTRSDAAGVSG